MLVVTSLAALNMSQAMVLCVGRDGHVAIEPAGHVHCDDGLPAQGNSSGPTNRQTGDHFHIEPQHRQTCIDIPIPVGAGDERIASERSKSSPARTTDVAPVILQLDAFNTADVPASALSWRPPGGSTLRHSTILQV